MGVYDSFADFPNQIRIEGQEITLNFKRTSDTTARVSWNIPPPAHGCSSERQAYDGIVITLSPVPANYIGSSPKNGTYYDGDATADYDLHAGSVLESARVVGAFYHDKTTVFLDITGISPKTPYYVSGYAVDAQARYHREGVHAYSIPTGVEAYASESYPARHEIYLYSLNPLMLKSPTGLLPNTNYNLPIKIECKTTDYTVNGSDAVTYGQLIDELNKQFALSNTSYAAPLPPHAGDYLKIDGLYYLWNGYILSPVNVVEAVQAPTIPITGTYWLNTTTDVLHVYVGGVWNVIAQIISSTLPPTELNSHTIWFDGTTVRVWEGGHWCDYTTIVSTRNPQLPPLLGADTYWFNGIDSELFHWNETLMKWDDALVIYYDTDPNTLNTGAFWYDEKNEKVKRFVASNWNTVTGVIYADADADGNLPTSSTYTVIASTYWYDTLNAKLYQRNLFNTSWDVINSVSYPTNPRIRKSCDLWWNSSPSVNDLYAWEAVTATWVPVGLFFRQDVDPNTPPLLDDKTAWVKPDGSIILITPQDCLEINYINSTTNPRDIQDGMIWKAPTGIYYVYTDNEWVIIDTMIKYPSDPYAVSDGMLWFDIDDQKFYKYGNSTWNEECISFTKDILPKIGQQWFNTVEELLMEWDGVTWLPSAPFIKVEFLKRPCMEGYDKLVFLSRKTGCHESFQIMSDNNTLFEEFVNSVIYTDPLDGYDGVDAGPMYKQLGVGDDGTPDERRNLHEQIKMHFGAPSTRVELTKQQVDLCIDNALLMLRKYSSYSYKKGMFFLDLVRHQQVYVLSNRCVGFNQIVDVLAIHRMRGGAFKQGFGGNDTFAFGALQQMYTLGTFDILTFHLASAYLEELDILFASRIMYQWVERKRELKIFQSPHGKERVLVEAIIERTEQDLLADRETAYWLRRWAIIEAKGMLAQIRGKFATLPGPNGTTTLNASDLQTQLEVERTELIEEIKTNGMQDLTGLGMKAHFLIG